MNLRDQLEPSAEGFAKDPFGYSALGWHRRARLGLLEHGNDLTVSETGPLHGTSSEKTMRKLHFWRQLICGGIATQPAMVTGKKHGPEIWLRKPQEEKPAWQLEFEPGTATFTAICREVQRAGVREDSTEVTVQLKPGEIYRLEADFAPPEYKCSVRPQS